MITRIALENFKCFREVEVKPKRITVFIGPNGSGKSSVLQALLLLKQSVGQESLSTEGPFVTHSIAPKFQPNGGSPIIALSGSPEDGVQFWYQIHDEPTGLLTDGVLRSQASVGKFGYMPELGA